MSGLPSFPILFPRRIPGEFGKSSVAASPLSTLLTKFAGTGGGNTVAFYRYVPAGANKQLMACIKSTGDNFYSCNFEDALGYMYGISAGRMIVGVSQETLKNGTGWTDVGSTGDSYLYLRGTYSHNETTGRYAEMTTPAGATRVGMFCVGSANAGALLVSIDGDNTLATSLPTAQDLVTGGSLDATVLVANGGTLNPTDRIFDEYNYAHPTFPRFCNPVEFADGLTAGAHTVRVTNTGYKNVSAGNDRIYISGMWHNAVTGWGDGDQVLPLLDRYGLSADSIFENAVSYTPTGATLPNWLGHSGSFANVSKTLYVDDVVTAMLNDGATTPGSTLKITQTNTFRHNETGATEIANVARTYTFTAVDGLRLQNSITWLVGGVSATAYMAMYPVYEEGVYGFSRGANIADGTPVTLTNDDGSTNVNAQSQAVYMWDADGNWGGVLYLFDLDTVNHWGDDTTLFFYIEDRSGSPKINKAYAVRNDSNLNVAINEVWSGDIYLRLKYFSVGAESELSYIG